MSINGAVHQEAKMHNIFSYELAKIEGRNRKAEARIEFANTGKIESVEPVARRRGVILGMRFKTAESWVLG